jgi:hypothetical protein
VKRLAIVVLLAACGAKQPEPASSATKAAIAIAGADAGAGTKHGGSRANGPTRSVDLAAFVATPEVQSVTPADAAAMINVAGLRAHPSAARIREHVVDKLGDGELFDAIEWIAFVGPDVLHYERGAVLVRMRDGVDVSWAVERVLRRASPEARAEIEPIAGLRTWRLPDDRADRVVLRVQPQLGVMTREPQAAAAARAFAKVVPETPEVHDVLAIFGRDRGAHLAGVLPEGVVIDRLRFVVEGYADGGARFRFEGHCPDAATAKTSADHLSEWLARQGRGIAMRIATRGLLNDAQATANGDTISVVVDANERQIEALVELFGASR